MTLGYSLHNPLTVVSRERPDKIAAKYEIPGKIVRLLSELQDIDPKAATALVAELAAASGVTTVTNGKQSSDDAVEQVRRFFAREPDVPKTKDEIVSGTGLSDSAVHTLIYRSKPKLFDSLPNPDGGRERVYRLLVDGQGGLP